ncbi:MAG TPA: hypothetical protein VKU00_19930 [Chthonomonadaceae bacterium]|nr:hypothetical protein [Chthonomonadaceae bacterium]
MSPQHGYIVALYSGHGEDAQIISASSDPELVARAAATMLHEKLGQEPRNAAEQALDLGRRAALRAIVGSDSQPRPARRCRDARR